MKSYLQVLKLMLSVDKKLLFKCLFIVIVLLGLESAAPVYMEWMIDRTETQKNVPAFVAYVAVFIAVYLGLCLLNVLRTELFERLGQHVLWKTREKIYHVLWESSYSDFVRDNKEKLKFILATESMKIYAISTVYTFGVIIDLFVVLLFMALAFYINSKVAVILTLSILVVLVLSFIARREMFRKYEAFENLREDDAIVNHETVDMVEAARTNGLEEYYLERNEKRLEEFFVVSRKTNKADAFWSGIEQAGNYIIFIMVAGVLFLTGSTGGQLVTVLFIANYLLQKSRDLQREVQVLVKNIPSFNKVVEAAEVPLETGASIGDERIRSIAFDSVALSYPDGREIFSGMSFQLKAGDHVLVEGVNGSGKSSLLKMIMGLLLPSEGKIEINGRNLRDCSHAQLYREICYVSQDELFLNESVEYYLRIVSHTDVSDKTISDMRKMVHLNEEIVRITDNGEHLSGGERKKLLLLKCMLREDASVIIMDEIDSGLDAETKELLHDMEEKLMRDSSKIVIKISHIDNNRSRFNKIIQMGS